MLSEPGTLSTSILDGLRVNDPAAWSRFVFLFTPVIYRWCRRRGFNEHRAEDVGQEVFRAVYRHIGSFKRDQPGQSFTAWLRRITDNEIHNQWRQDGRSPTSTAGDWFDIPDTAESADDEANLLPSDKRALVERALAIIAAEFKPKTVEAFKRLVLDGQEPHEIAEQLTISVNTVYLAKSRIIKRLRAELSDFVDLQ